MQSLKVEIHHILGMVAGAWLAAFVLLCLVAIYLLWKVTR